MNKLQAMDDLRSYLRDNNNTDLYVVNTSHLDGSRKRSECIFTIVSGGNNVHIGVKDTFIPQNIGLKAVTLMDFAKSEDFNRYVALGFLNPIDPAVAEEYLKTPEARTEYSRLSGVELGDNLSTGSVDIVSARNIKASAKVVGIMMNDMDASKKISAFKNIANELTADDIKYIIQNAKAQDEKVKAWANSFNR